MGANAEGKISLSVELQNFKNIAGNLKKGLTQELKQIPLDVKFDNKDLEEQATAAIIDINKMFTKTKLKNLDFRSILPAFVNEINRGDISDATRLQIIEGFKTGLENLKEGGLKQSYAKLKGFSADDLMNYFLDSNTAEDILNSFKGLSKRQKQGLRSSVLPSLSELKGRGWDAADKEYTKGAKRLEALMKLSGEYGDVLQYGTNPTATKNIISELDKRFKSGNMSKNDAQDVIGYLLRSDFLGIDIKEELKNQETNPTDLINEAKNVLGDSANVILESLKERAQAFFTAYDNIFNSTAKKITYKELLENIENTTNKKFLGLYNAEASNVLEEVDVGKLFKESVKIKSDEKPELRKREKKEDVKDTTRTKPHSEEELKEFEFDDEEKEIQNLEEEINEITKRLEEIRNKIDENIQRRQQLENEIKSQEDLVGKKNKAYLDFKNDYDKYTVSARNAKYESDALKGTVENLDNQLEEEKQNKEKIEKKYNELIAKREAIKKEIEEKEKQLSVILPSIEQQETDLEKQLADLINKKTKKQKEVKDKEAHTKETLSLQDEWLEWYDEALQQEYNFKGTKAKSEAFDALKRLGNKYLEFKKNPDSSTATDKEAEAARFAVKHYKLWQAAKEAGVAESRLERERFDTDDDLAYKQAVDYLQQQRNHTEDFKKQIKTELELSKAELDETKKEIQETTEKQKQLQTQKKQLLGDLRRKPAEKEDSNEANIRREKTKLDSSNSKIQKIEEQKRIADNQLKETEQYLERNELTPDRETQYKNQLQRLEEENNIQEKILQEKREELEKEIEEKDRLIRLGQELASKQDLLIEQQKKAKEKQEELNREKEEKRKQEELNRRQEEERRKQANESEASSKEENQTEKSQSSKTEETTDIGTTTSISPEKLQEILTLLGNIQKALGTLEDGSDIPSITQSIKNMADALRELSEALGEIKQKDFNFNIGLPNNNPIGQKGEIKRKVIKELQLQYDEFMKFFGGAEGLIASAKKYSLSQSEHGDIGEQIINQYLIPKQFDTSTLVGQIDELQYKLSMLFQFSKEKGLNLDEILSNSKNPSEIIKQISEDIVNTNPVAAISKIFKDIKISIDASMAQINAESKGFNFLSGSAEEAAEAKRKFVEANKDVLQSIIASMPKIEQEAEALEEIANQKNKREKKENKNSDLKDEVKTEEKKNEELLKFQEARNKVFEQGYSAQLDQQKKEEKIAQKQFQTALEQSRLQEQANNFNVNKEITSKYNRELALDQGRQFQLDEQIKKAEQAKKLTQTELEQNRLSAQIEQVQKERSLKIKKTLEQNRESQLDEQIKKAEQAKKLTQIELEQARLAGQYDQASVMRQRKEQEQLKKEQDIKEYEKQFNDWNEEENGQLTFLDKNTHDLTEEYEKAVQEEIAHAQEVAKKEAKNNPVDIPLEGQISFTSNEDIDQIMKIYSDKGRQQAEKQFAKMRRSNEYINSETNIEKYLKPYENLSYGIEPTKYISELADVSSKIQDVKTELESSFDPEGKMVGNPLRIQELFKQYDALVLKVKELKAIISSPTSQENITLELAKEAEKAKEKVKETKEELDELKNKITSTFDVGRSDEILTSKTEAFIKSYGSLSDKNNINTLIAPIEGSGFEEQQSKVIALREELKKYKEAVEELKQLKNSDIVDLNTLTEADKKVKDLETSINAMMKSIRASGTSNASTSQVDKFARQIEAFMIKNPRITLEAKNSLNEYLQTLKSGESISKTALGAMADGFAKVKIEQEQAGKLGYNIWDQMILKMREGVAFLATKFSFYQIFNQFRQGITIVKEFDDALTEMQKVSDETMLTLQRYQKTTFDVAESIGSTALQVQQSTADFLRLGESLEEAAKSAKAANVLMNVSEFESINDATTSLIALSAAYNDLTKENIIDKLNEVGNNYSISTSGAAEALQMSASALKTAQNDMNESLALVTAGNQVVQDISKAGNGLRTIALRLTGTKSAKEELEEMGEETENVITTQSKLRDVIKEATAVESNAFKGFDILNDNGNYKSTYEIMLGIAQIYDEIVETDKKLGRNNVNLLLETVAGKTRANVAASIFQSPDILQKAYASSISANGSAQEENQKYLESISGHLAQLQSKWQEVWSKTANREIINFFIDLGKEILEVVDKIGLIPSALMVLVPYFEIIRTGATNSKGVITILLEALSTLNEVEEASNVIKAESETISLLKAASTQVENEALRQQIEACIEAAVAEEAKNTVGKESTALSLLKKASLEVENAELKEAIGNYIKLAEAEGLEGSVASSSKSSKGVGLLATKFDLLKKAASGAKTAIVGTLGATGAAFATVGVAAAAIAGIAVAVNNHMKEEAIANAQEVTESLNKQDESLQKQIDSYEELKTKLDSGDLSEKETLETKQQIYDIQKQITEEYGTAAQGVDLVNGKLEKQVSLLNTISQKEAQTMYSQNYEGFEAAIDEYTKDRKYGFSLSSPSKEIQDALSAAGMQVYGSGSGTFMAQIKDDATSSIKSLEKAKVNLEELKEQYKNTETEGIIDSEIKKIDKAIGDAYEAADEYKDTALKGLELRLLSRDQNGYNIFENYQSSVSNLENAYISGDTKKINEARLAYIDATKEKDKFFNNDYNKNKEYDILFKSIDTSIIEKKNQYADVTELLNDIVAPEENRSLLKQEEDKNDLYKDNSKALRKYTDSEKKVRKEAERLYKLNPDRIDIEGTLLDNTYASGKYANALNSLQNALGWSADDAQSLVDILIDVGIVQGSAADIADYSADSYSNFSSSVEGAINALSVLNTVMSESYSGQGITDQTLEQFKQTFGEGAYQALEKTANGYHINAQEAYSLRKQQEALVDTDYSSALSQQYNALNKLNEGYRKAIYNNEDTSAFAEQRKAIENNITKLQDRMMAFNNANSAYQTWVANQSNNGERQMYESIYGGFDTIKDEFEHGWAGVKTRSWMDLILGDESEADFDVWDAQATELKKRYDQLSKDIEGTGGYSIKDFFTADDNGKITSTGVMNFFKAIENKQNEVGEKFVDLEEGWFDFTNGGDQRIANLFGIDIEAVDAILRAAAEAGAEVKLDQPIFSAERLEEEAIKAKTSLEKDLGGELNINLNPDSIEEANLDMAKLTEYRDKLASDTSLEPTVKTKRLEELSDIMAYISTKEREIVENSIIDFEVKNTDLIKADKEINSIFSGLEHYSDRFGKRTDGINKILSVDPSTLNDLTSLKDFYGTVREAKLTPEVNDEQVAMLDALLKAIEDKINAINNKPVEGQSLSFSQYEKGLKTITQINNTIKKAKESGADFEFNWEGDEEFMSLVEFIDGLDAKQKMQLGLDPDINAQQILEIAKNGGTIELDVESNTTPAQLTTPQPQTKQELQQVITTELKAHDTATPTIENASKSAGYFGKTYTAELKAEDNASKEIEKPQKKADEFGKTKKEAQVDVKGADTSNAKIDDVKTNLLSMPNKISSSINIDVFGAGKISNALDDLSKLRNAARNNIHLNITKANGTAHAQGTAFSKGSIVSGNAFAGGKWGISKNQTALTGELGTEIVVRDGNWFTVGEDGAEFVNLQKGDIVFNHKQAQELLENGYVTSNKGRGHLVGFANGSAFASGSAYDGGSTGSTLGMLNSTADKKTTSKTTSSNKDTSKGKTTLKTTPKTTNKEANKTKNTLDEVEILIARIERQIANLDKTISSTYKTWSTRNAAIKSDLTKVAKEIKEQSKAYTTYMRKANSIQIATDKNADGSTKSAKDKKKQSDTWKKRIQNGQQIIRDISNQDIWDKIQEYKQWYEKALQSKDAIIDLKEKEGELYKQRFDNEQTYYEERIADIQHYIDLLETYNDTLSESGKLGSKVLIQDQISRETIRLNELNKEYKSLIARRDEAVKSGKIKKYSEAWYEIEEVIHEVDESIAEANNNLVTYANNMRQLDWDRWDKVHDAIGGVNNELEFLYDLFNADDFFDDQGNLTDQGVTAFALLAQQYDTYFREAQEYQKEIEATEELLKADKGKNKYDQNLVDKLKELKESQQDAISNAKKMKDSMVDLTEDGIKKQIDYVKDLIEDYEELLEAQKDQTDYAKKVADQQKEINKLEKQYRAIQNDTSEEGATKRQKLRDQINEKRQDLKDTQEDRRISETKDMLSDFQENFEDFLDNKLKDVEGVVREVINRTNANGTIINDTITTLANSYGYTPSDTLKNTLTDLSNNLVSYFNSVFDNENVRTIASGVDEIVKYYQEAQNKSETIGQTQSNEAMSKQVKETGSHVQSYTDDSGKVKLGFFNNDGTQNKTYSGWAQKDGKQYLFTNGSVDKKNQWYTGQNGKRYYLNGSGARVTGIQTIKGKTYFFNSDGTKSGNKNGWVTSGSKKYYFKNGAAVTGWYTINKKRYYFGTDGKMYKGLKTIGNKKYYFDSNGVLLKGIWRKINNKQYYLDKKDGHVLTGKQTIDGKKYTFNTDGSFKKNGWKKGTASVPKTGMAWTNEGYKTEAIIRKSDGAILTPLNRGDSVIPNSAMKNMYRALTDPEKYLKQYTTPDVRIVQGNGSTNNQSPTINMQFIANGVQDANKFANELMNNKKLEKWIQEVTLGQANGHNSFRKYSYAIR